MPRKNDNIKKDKKARDVKLLQQRRNLVEKMRFVQRWAISDIVSGLRDKGYQVSETTVKRDLIAIRKHFKLAAKDYGNDLEEIIQQIKSRSDERLKILWNEYIKIEQQEKILRDQAKEKSDKSGKTSKIPGLGILVGNKLKILSELRKCDDSLAESLRKLGIGTGSLEDESDILIEIKARRAKVNANNNSNTGSDNADDSES